MAMDEARMEQTEHGKVAATEGWYVLHTSEAPWMGARGFGKGCRLEGSHRFPQLGFQLRVLEPGQPACKYHRENAQEDFLVISGECLLVVEGRERRLRAGHFVHCPPGTDHVFVGAGEGPCTVLMVGARPATHEIVYPVSDAAARHGASVETETSDPAQAYAGLTREPAAPAWPPEG